MKPSEVRELTTEDLKAKLAENRTELFNLRFQMATSQLDNTARARIVKKDIARILTEMRARELNAQQEVAIKLWQLMQNRLETTARCVKERQ